MFSAANGNAITVSDSDSINLKVTLTVAEDSLGGSGVDNGRERGTASVAFTGTVSAIFTGVNGLTFTPAELRHRRQSAGADRRPGQQRRRRDETDSDIAISEPVADTPSITNATTSRDTRTTRGLVISRNVTDGESKISDHGVTGGMLFRTTARRRSITATSSPSHGPAPVEFTPSPANSSTSPSTSACGRRSTT